MTIKEIISDVELKLNQLDISDDSALSWPQVKSWITTHANSLVTTELNSKLAKNEMIPAMYLTHDAFEITEPEEEGTEDRISITLENEVLVLNNDGGIVIIQTDDGEQVLKAGSINTIMLVRKMRFAKPSGKNFVYYRQGEKIYIEGQAASDIGSDKFHVWYVQRRDYTTAADSTEVVVSDLVLPVLISSLVQEGKLALYGTQVDRNNDGVDAKEPVYHTAIQNPENSTQ